MSYRCQACRADHSTAEQGRYCAAVVLLLSSFSATVVSTNVLSRDQLAAIDKEAERMQSAARKIERQRAAGLTPRGRRGGPVRKPAADDMRPLMTPLPTLRPVADGPAVDDYRTDVAG